MSSSSRNDEADKALFFCPNLLKGGDSLGVLKADMPKTEMTTEYGTINKNYKKEQEIKTMMNNNFNNGAANNNNNSNNGGFIMAQGTLTTIEAFAGTVKTAMEAHYGADYKVTVQDVQKNNGLVLTGITILKKDCNIAPTIYLNQAFEQYQEGRTIESICREFIRVYVKISEPQCEFIII